MSEDIQSTSESVIRREMISTRVIVRVEVGVSDRVISRPGNTTLDIRLSRSQG